MVDVKVRIEATFLIEYPYDCGTEYDPMMQAYYRLIHSAGEETAAMFFVIVLDRMMTAKNVRFTHEMAINREQKIAEAWWPFNWLRRAIQESRHQ